jgi:transcriptional regulator with XRE-family HTH domain
VKETLAKRIRRLRAARGLTQRGLAEKCGLPHNSIHLLESGKQDNPTLSTLAALAAELRVTIGQLVGENRSAGRRAAGGK